MITVSGQAASVSDVEIKVGVSWEDLVGVIPQWTDLVAAAGADGFSRPQFCMPCWSESAYGAAHIVHAWQGNQLVALAPLWWGGLGPVGLGAARLLSPIGTGPLTRAAVLSRPGAEQAAAQLVGTLLTSFAALIVEHPVTAPTPAPNSTAHRHLGGVRRAVLGCREAAERISGVALPTCVDADEWSGTYARTDWYPAGRDTGDRGALSFTLVQTVVDCMLRANLAAVISDTWRGSSIWLVGTDSAQLWTASGSCRPGGAAWPATLSAAARWAAGRGLATIEMPGTASTAELATGISRAPRRSDVTMLAASRARLKLGVAATRLSRDVRRAVAR